MAIDWNKVATDALDAAKNVVGAEWSNVATPAGQQVTALVAIGQQIETDFAAGKMDQSQYSMLKAMQKNAISGVLSAYTGIGIVVAEQAAAAAWNVVATALGSLAGFALV
ncbi:MAG: hypothetical protein JOY64_29870 [Alphaproteobacteria bacterium]|nr:hypothetical protein [Alphaproteobacteria bacterium]MBV8411870.1 hypothetical protein [Alphaproteobacteria bacterium]